MEEQAPVLIVGGSLVGLTASLLLGRYGVPHIVIERHRGTAIHPRAAAFHQRTLEIFRSAGVEQAVEQAAEREFVQNGAIMAVDSLAGRELAWFYRSVNEGVEDLSPSRRIFITQIGLEPVLRDRAAEMGADLRYATEMTGFTQDGDGVLATIRSRDDGDERRIRARFMIAADGAHSPVRRALGLGMTGRGDFAECFTIYFKADVRALLRDRNLSVVYVNQPDLLAFFRFSITADAGFLAVFKDKSGARETAGGPDLSPEHCAALVRTALGVGGDFPVDIENVQPWTAAASTAPALRRDNVFLAGDAAHVMPPTGGFGGNTGVADVHNLVWKLAMVLRGEAGPELLDSYDEERRPIAALTVEQAYRRYVERVDPTLPSADLAPNLADTAIELGSIYRSGAVIAEGAAEAADDALVEAPEHPSGRPGTRLPHRWLQSDAAPVSTLDLAGRSFALLAGPDGQAWMAAARRQGVLDAHRIAEDGVWAAFGATDGGALLLRPDGVIGWRSRAADADPDSALADALRRLRRR